MADLHVDRLAQSQEVHSAQEERGHGAGGPSAFSRADHS